MALRRRPALAASAAAVLALVTACSSGAGGSGSSGAAGPTSTGVLPAPSSSSPAGSAPAALVAAQAITGVPGPAQDVVTDLDVPWAVAVLPDGTALVSERDTARVVRVAADGSSAQVVATGTGGAVPGVVSRGEGGLLGLAVSPDFATDGLVYAYATTAGDDRVLRMRLTGGGPGGSSDAGGVQGGTLSEPEALLTGITSATVHHGGRLAFGPDGMLYATTGDASAPSTAQDPSAITGKVLRLTPGGDPAPGNPVEGSPVWTYGHRNPQGVGWDADGRMFAAEFGQDTQDELNLLEPGKDYGWPLVEGTVAGPAGDDADVADPRFTAPLVTWPTAQASPSGLLVTGDAVYVAALRGERLWRVPLADGVLGEPEALLEGEHGRIRDVVAGPDGSLWVLTNNTARGSGAAGDDRVLRLPMT